MRHIGPFRCAALAEAQLNPGYNCIILCHSGFLKLAGNLIRERPGGGPQRAAAEIPAKGATPLVTFRTEMHKYISCFAQTKTGAEPTEAMLSGG